MELSPNNESEKPKGPDEKSLEEKTGSKKKLRKSFELGSVAVDIKEPKREVPPERPKPDHEESSWFPDRQAEEEVKSVIAEKAETVSEAEAPADGTLSQTEKETVILVQAKQAAEQLEAQPAASDPEASYVDMKLAEYYDKLQENPDIDAVAEEIIAAEGIDLPDEEVVEEAPEPIETTVFSRSDSDNETLDDEDEDEDDPAAATASAAGSTGGGAGASSGSGSGAGGGAGPAGGTAGGGTGGGGAGAPPTGGGFHGPGGPFGPGPGPAGPGGPPFGPFGGVPHHTFNAAPTPAATAPIERNPGYLDTGPSPAAMALAGGIIGYLIGRRRGRIKTEKRLLPIQKKLEKQVEDLHWQIKAQERKIRRVAAEKVQQQGPAVVQELAARQVAAKAEQPVKPVKESLPVETRQRAPEAHQLHGGKAKEKIGQMLMAAELVPASRVERPAAEARSLGPDRLETANIAKEITPRRVETMNRSELLEISENIIVEGSSLRRIYETNLLGERGLRRLIQEHLRGGDLKKALRQEITEREIDFERDPVMRDIAPVNGAGGGASSPTGTKTVLDEMVAKAASSISGDSEEAAFYKARSAYEAEQLQKSRQHQRLVDTSFAVIIAVLLGVVVMLAITRG
jgi:hypothetical protein